ncbi:predicted protein [Histoplasma mississippiense (nom. inval.)]|uniref:predicted protein n=1 Tax=Ajellomyces capsulatus (strain NAm1 / WU24) TaxID=2059318 RepID=UPI000157C09B|nr:predicted protein [Histoplasma mississippiense (nom. inval.)]EDN06879.1 predicted protein [Histoplasma mississippiense (nom. inval.)]
MHYIAAETKQGLETKILEHEVEDVVRRRFDRSVDVSMRLAKNGLGVIKVEPQR